MTIHTATLLMHRHGGLHNNNAMSGQRSGYFVNFVCLLSQILYHFGYSTTQYGYVHAKLMQSPCPKIPLGLNCE